MDENMMVRALYTLPLFEKLLLLEQVLIEQCYGSKNKNVDFEKLIEQYKKASELGSSKIAKQ